MTDVTDARADARPRTGPAGGLPPLYHRRLVMLCVSQAVGSVGLAAGAVAGPLLAETVTGSAAYGPAPLGLLVVGSALSAPLVTGSMHRVGRARGLAACYFVAAAGAAVVVLAGARHLAPLLVGSLLLGVGNTGVMLGRYAAADLVAPQRRAEAMGVAMAAVTVGAVAGPALLGPAGWLAGELGLPAALGLFVLALVMFPATGVIGLLADRGGAGAAPPAPVAPAAAPSRGARLFPLLVLAATNLTMVSVMGAMPNHLRHHDWDLHGAGLVIGMHVAAMFGPSPLTGRLIRRLGHRSVSVFGAVLMVAAMLVGVLRPGDGDVVLLLLLGLGWNMQLLGGTAWLIDVTPAALRHRAEGLGEVVMGMAAATGTLVIAGPLLAIGDLPVLCLAFVALNVAATAVFVAGGRR